MSCDRTWWTVLWLFVSLHNVNHGVPEENSEFDFFLAHNTDTQNLSPILYIDENSFVVDVTLYHIVNFLGHCSVPMFSVQKVSRRHLDILTLEGQYTVLPQNVRIQLHSDTVAYPGRTEPLKMEELIVREGRGTSLKNLASSTSLKNLTTTYTTAEAWNSCCMLSFCIALLMQGCFHKPFKYILFQYTYVAYVGGLGVVCWPLVPKFAGSNPAEAVRFLGWKNPQHAFLRGEVKLRSHVVDLRHVKDP